MTDLTPPTSPSKESPKATLVKIAAAFIAPLFFIIAFPLLFVGAIHKPTPNDLSLLIVGPDQVVSQIADNLDVTSEFSATHTDVEGEAKSSVENRTVMGSIEVIPDATGSASAAEATFTVTTFVATAEGQAVAATVIATGTSIAEQLGTTAAIVEVAPLDKQDPLGTNLFSLLTYTSLAAYLVIIVLMQVLPQAKLRVRYAAVGVAAIVAPLMVFGLSSIFVGDYGASFGTIAALLGVNALYVFTVGAAAVLIEQFLGKIATIGIMGFIVLLNFPSSGGPTPAALLPDFWQALHSFYFGSGAYESFRSIIYFDGNGVQRWILQLAGWTLGLILVTVIVHLAGKVRLQNAEIVTLTAAAATAESIAAAATAESTAPDSATESSAAVSIKHETYEIEPQPDQNYIRSITAGEGANR